MKSKNAKKASTNSKPNARAHLVKAPAAQGKVLTHLGEPKITPLGKSGDCLVIHKEYISDLVASATSGAFTALGIPINPGNTLMFPWLSEMADKFESYVFRALKFCFETDAPSSQPGSVLMAVDYDVKDELPSSKRDMMSLQGAVRTVDWKDVSLNCVKESLHKRKTYYVGDSVDFGPNYNPSESPADSRLEDVGELIVASSNSTANANLGELYVEYAVELMTPDSHSGANPYFEFNVDTNQSGQDAHTALDASSTHPWGNISTAGFSLDPATYPSLGMYQTLGVRVDAEGDSGSNRIYFAQAGTYLLAFDATLASAETDIIHFATTNFHNCVERNPRTSGAEVGVTRSFFVEVTGSPDIDGDTGWFDINLLKADETSIGNSHFGAGYQCLMRVCPVPDWTGLVAEMPHVRPSPGRCYSCLTRHHKRTRKTLRLGDVLSERSSSCSQASSSLAGNAARLGSGKNPRTSDPGLNLTVEGSLSLRRASAMRPDDRLRQAKPGQVRVFDPVSNSAKLG
jgi:hypothetical protein